MLPIQEKYIQFNFTKGRKRVEYIIIHDTGNFGKGANALSHYNYFNSGNRNASADYFVDDSNIIKLIPDNCFSWAVGDGKSKYGITNSNSISIEMCVNSDGDFDKTQENTIDLIKFLMQRYNISIDKVVRHYDASRKNCPQTLHTDADWKGWILFKERLNTMEVKINPDQEEFDTNIKLMKQNNIIDLDSLHKPDEPVTWFALSKVAANIIKLSKGE